VPAPIAIDFHADHQWHSSISMPIVDDSSPSDADHGGRCIVDFHADHR